MSREPERCSHGVLDGARCRPCDEVPDVELVEGGDFVVTVTYSVQLRVPDVAELARVEGKPADVALVDAAIGKAIVGFAGWAPDSLVEVVQFSRAHTEVVPADERPTDMVLRQLRAKLAERPQ